MTIGNVLKTALDHFIVKRYHRKTVIAGYPWFLDWGRDALIVTRGLIATGDTETAGQILKMFGQYEQNGTLPNALHGDQADNRDTSDAPLWLLVACRDWIQKEKSRAILEADCSGRSLLEIMRSIIDHYIQGTPNGIKMDFDSGLIFSPPHFTWMDTNYPAGTPREGYPIEIQALWYAALSFLGDIDPAGQNYRSLAEKVRKAIDRYFYNDQYGYLSDCLHAEPDQPPGSADPDDTLRPNQLFAITFEAMTDKAIGRTVLDACQKLLVPGGIRSLADQPSKRPLEIVYQGQRLGNPHRPYRGRYMGDEDTSRKPAYHNGTAWTWLFPVYCEAWTMIYGRASKKTALAWMSSVSRLLESGCIGHIPEILDGDFPHRQRGCPAQAWGVSENLRVWLRLHN
jgi:predicted glycogen debranching enzyme